MALEDCEFVFELRYADYSQSCREAGVEPSTFEALKQLIAALTETQIVGTPRAVLAYHARSGRRREQRPGPKDARFAKPQRDLAV